MTCSAAALATSLGPLAAPLVGVVFGVLVFLPLGTLTILEHRAASRLTAML